MLLSYGGTFIEITARSTLTGVLVPVWLKYMDEIGQLNKKTWLHITTWKQQNKPS